MRANIRRWLRKARGQAAIGGQATGVGVGVAAVAASGGTTAAVALGTAAVLTPAATDVLSRLLSRRERRRVTTLVDLATRVYEDCIEEGLRHRDDGFFAADEETGRSSADEVIEGALVIAKDTYEERKLKHLAYFVGIIPFDGTLTPVVANQMLKVAERLSWTQYVLLAAIGRKEGIELPKVDISTTLTSWDNWSVYSQLRELIDDRLISPGRRTTERLGFALQDYDLSTYALNQGGKLMHHYLHLDEIGATTVAAVLKLAEPEAESEQSPEN